MRFRLWLPAAVTPLKALLLLALAVKAGAIASSVAINPDGVRYVNAARQFLEGDFHLGLSWVGFMPFYPLLIAGTRLLIPDWVLAGQILSALALTLAVIPVYLLARDLFGRTAAFWSGAAFVLSPELNEYAADIIREPLFALFLLWAIWFARRALLAGGMADSLAASACAVVAGLCRLEGLLLIPLFVAALVISAIRNGAARSVWLRRAAAAALPAFILVLLGLSFLPAPEVLFSDGHAVGALIQDLRRFDLTGTYPQVSAALQGLERTTPNAYWSNDLAEIARHNLPLIYLVGLLQAFGSSFYWPFALLAFLGLREKFQGRAFLLVLAGTCLAVDYFLLLHRNFISPRYLLAAVLPLYPCVGAGAVRLLDWCRNSSHPRFTPLLAAILLLLPAWGTLADWRGGNGVVVEAGTWLSERKELANSRLICNDERVAFYAGLWRGEYILAPTRDVGEMTQLAAAQGSTLLILEGSIRKTPAMADPEGFSNFKDFTDGRNRVVIYRRQP